MTSVRPPFRDRTLEPDGRGSSYDGDARRDEAPESLPEAPACPFCDGDETEIMSAFGAHASVSTYWCRPCGSPFDLMRWRLRDSGPAGRGSGG